MDIKQQTVTLYARVSSQEQASEGVSIEAQLALLRSHAQAQGWWAGGRTLYGYRWLAAEQRWEINEDEAKVVRHVYDLYLNEKLGTGLIPFRLKEEGYRTRSGHRFGFTARRVRRARRETSSRLPMGVATT
jgi:DNA invertase Pin-like site-specific DNA recombinase